MTRQTSAEKHPSCLLTISETHWAVFEIQRQLKTHFDVALSHAFSSLVGNREINGSCSDGKRAETLSLHLLDTLQICNKLIQWCVESAQEIADLFSRKALLVEYQEAQICGIEDSGISIPSASCSSEGGEGDTVRVRNLLCKLVQQHAEQIAEFRNLVAHDILSITKNECSAVLVSIKCLVSGLISGGTEKWTRRSNENDRLLRNKALQFCTKGGHFHADCIEARILATMELLMAVERTIVRLFQSLSAEAPTEVSCISTLCSLLRNEELHHIVTDAFGVDPRLLTVKCFPAGDVPFQDLKIPPTSQRRRKSNRAFYSHLDILFMARNMFNHASFRDISRAVVCQWLRSGIAMISAFDSPERGFGGATARLQMLHDALLDADTFFNVSVCQEEAPPPKSVENISLNTHLPTNKIRPPAGKVVMRLLKKSASRAFVGREDILHRLEQVATKISSDRRIIILSGHPGIGKSYTALRAAQSPRISGLFQVCYWITATTNELLLSSLVGLINGSGILLADYKMPMQKILNLTLDVCRHYSCYIVFDDVTSSTAPAVRQITTSLDVQGVALVTTCVKGLDLSVAAEELDVEALTMEESFALLELITRGSTLPLSMSSATQQNRVKVWDDIAMNRAVVERIVDSALGRSPLGVTLLGHIFVNERNFMKVAGMFSGLEEFSTVTSQNKAVFAQRHSGLEITVRHLLRPIQDNKRLLSLLYAMSIMSPNGIPLRLLLHFGEESRSQKCFLESELAILEGVGLVSSMTSSASMHLSKTGEEIVFVMIHQLTQRALRHILPVDFGIVPIDVCQAVVQGFWRDQKLDDFSGVYLGGNLHNPEETFKWADCILFSLLARQIIDFFRETTEEDGATKATARQLMDGLLLSCLLLPDLYPRHVQRVYLKLSLLREEDLEGDCGPCIVGDILLRLEDDGAIESVKLADMAEADFRRTFLLCGKQRLPVELFSGLMVHVIIAAGKPRLVMALVSAFSSLENRYARSDLVNAAALLRCRIAWAMSVQEGRAEEALALLGSEDEYLVPGAKYYSSSQLVWQYHRAIAMLYIDRFDEGLALLNATIDAQLARGNMLAWSNVSNTKASTLMEMGRLEEALALYKQDLNYVLTLFREGTNQRKAASAHARLGRCYCHVNNFAAAESHYLAFESIRSKLGHKDEIWSLWNMCWVYWKWGKYSLAWEWSKRRFLEVGGIENGPRAYMMARKTLPLYLYALGPKRATRELLQLKFLDDPVLEECAAKLQTEPRLSVYFFILRARTNLWLGNYAAAWQQIVEGLPVKARINSEHLDVITVWYFDVQLLSAAVLAHKAGVALALPKHSNAKHDFVEKDQSDLGVNELLQSAWKECVVVVDRSLPDTDVSWRYEYARLLLWVSENQQLQNIVRSSPEAEVEDEQTHSQQLTGLLIANSVALRGDAAKILDSILSAPVEVTEWTQMARELLSQQLVER